MSDKKNKPASVSPSKRQTVAIILAAGRSTRMKTERPKVLHEICGRPLLAYVLDACRGAGIDRQCVVVGFGKEQIVEAFGRTDGVEFVEQNEQKGTGHAVQMCEPALKDFDGDVVVIAGDMPMIEANTLQDLVGSHRASGAASSIATTFLDEPAGYGRIVRDKKGDFEKIVEHRDCSPEQLKINEVNPSYYCFDAKTLFDGLNKIKPDNAKGEYYLTDVLYIALQAGKPVRASVTVPAEDAVGINSRRDLAEVGKVMQQRIANYWMDNGVTIVDPQNTWIDSRAIIGPETEIKPFCFIEGTVRIGAGCVVGPFAHLQDGTVVEDGAQVGPGALNAFDAARSPRSANPANKRNSTVLRRPPAAAPN